MACKEVNSEIVTVESNTSRNALYKFFANNQIYEIFAGFKIDQKILKPFFINSGSSAYNVVFKEP